MHYFEMHSGSPIVSQACCLVGSFVAVAHSVLAAVLVVVSSLASETHSIAAAAI